MLSNAVKPLFVAYTLENWKYSVTSQNRTPLGLKKRFGLKRGFGLERFYMYSKYREQDLKAHPA